MTGYTVHTGSSDKFASGWDQVFSANKPDAKGKAKKSAAKAAKSAKAKSKKSSRKVKRGK